MTAYTAPVTEMLYVLRHVIGEDRLKTLPGGDGLSDLLEPVLVEAGRLAETVLAPLNAVGDREGAHLTGTGVVTPKGWKDAYKAYTQGGWNGVPFPENWGGQGLPWVLAFPVQEMWQAANMAFGLCPLLNQGAIEAIMHHGTPDQKELYLHNLVGGQWTGTMNLTEAQAGSDLAAIATRARREPDGSYRITGQKIFITYGDHDLTDNIIHLVLARLPDAPEGVKGLSLFIVPKVLADGTRNDVKCVALEHKLGIHASPTCTMAFGDAGGATGYLIGHENEGVRCMFTMMNNARLSVGLQGVAMIERAGQAARGFAGQRMQGGKLIAEYPDVKRMLLTMQAYAQAGRIMAIEAAFALDDNDRERADLLTPVVKAWCTDRAVEAASLGIQVHGGMGYIEDTGAAQYLRDARILPIYEGTNGIQAADLVFRKVLKDDGKALTRWMDELTPVLRELEEAHGNDLSMVGENLVYAVDALKGATGVILAAGRDGNTEMAGAVSYAYLTLAGHVMAGAALARAGLAARRLIDAGDTAYDQAYLEGKIILARFFADHVLVLSGGLARTVRTGGDSVFAANL